jgi:glycosyltransferase involved in cell wall biosynthesis
MKILHVSSIDPLPNSGMGRVSYHWKNAFEKAGHQFIHVGKSSLQKNVHKLFLGKALRKYIINKRIDFDVVFAHEPLAGFLKFKNKPLIVFSHGIEERAWENAEKYSLQPTKLKNKLLPQWLRFYANNLGFKKADLILLLNKTDKEYLISTKKIKIKRAEIIKNGYYTFSVSDKHNDVTGKIVFLFNGTWIERKGKSILSYAFNIVLKKYNNVKLIIAGVSVEAKLVLENFDSQVISQINVIPKFTAEEEKVIYAEANVFILPSYFEGQSLALTQAMAMGLCPLVSDNSGQLDFVQNLKNGLLFKTGNKKDFLEKTEGLIKNKDLISSLGVSASKSVLNFTWQNVSDAVVKLCESVIEKKK